MEAGREEWCERLCKKEDTSGLVLTDAGEEVSEIHVEIKEIEVFHFIVFGLGFDFGFNEVFPIDFEA